jgi:hypothetical protein
MEAQPKTILASPLEWGLGHTVRMVPFIRKAIADGHRVILASDGLSLQFLRNHFPGLPWVVMPFYPVRYPAGSHFFSFLLPQVPGIFRSIRNNHRQVKLLVKEYGITEILSDHRYGLTHKNVHSIFITNQLWLKAPNGFRFAERFIYRLHRFALRKFSEIRIADHAGEPNLSGLLTHPPRLPKTALYIGPVSRFQDVEPVRPGFAQPFKVLALVSGPEPQRSIFEKLVLEKLLHENAPSVILRGLPPSTPGEPPAVRDQGPVMLIDHAVDGHIAWYILHASKIICRPGNSTLSDLTFLGRTALLVPTPGQTEQEYVARHLEKQGKFTACMQDELRDLTICQ